MASPTKRDFVRIRNKLRLTQERMAQLLGVSFVSVNRWEMGHSAPLRAVVDLYAALDAALKAGYEPDEIVDGASSDRRLFLRNLFRMAYGSLEAST
ncbi:MAG: helix-turn-helix domain-containing protein [Myxococcales bacterium]|nr:helix-turn-helix domain-containing protein [Myxococcales bacterium]